MLNEISKQNKNNESAIHLVKLKNALTAVHKAHVSRNKNWNQIKGVRFVFVQVPAESTSTNKSDNDIAD